MSIEKYSIIIYALFFGCAVLFSFLINSLFYKFSKTLGIRNNTEEIIIRWGSQQKPAVGGISFYILFLLSLAVYSIFFPTEFIFKNKPFIGFLLSINFGFLMGLADDAFNTRPLLKLFIQVLCAVCLIVSGIYIHVFKEDYLNYLLTIFWVVGIMNSINMLDNMDAVAAIMSIAVILAAMMIIFILGDYSNIYFISLTGVLAALIGFLILNWHPSKIYMGDTGSQFLGIFLATIGIIFFWNYPNTTHSMPTSERFIIPIMAFMMTIFDTTIVVFHRLSNRTSPFIGGKDHTTHALARMGLSEQMVALVFLFMALINIGLLYVILNYIEDFNGIVEAVFIGYLALCLTLVFMISWRHKEVVLE
jgi:UDP-GlcNAc:undecaprenyl-phosphate GlcNAc-1-phosphate transferase